MTFYRVDNLNTELDQSDDEVLDTMNDDKDTYNIPRHFYGHTEHTKFFFISKSEAQSFYRDMLDKYGTSHNPDVKLYEYTMEGKDIQAYTDEWQVCISIENIHTFYERIKALDINK